MSQSILVKAAVLRSLRDAEAYVESLAALRRQVHAEVAVVTREAGGSASGTDRRAVAELHAAVAELDGLIGGVRRAVADGRRFADAL